MPRSVVLTALLTGILIGLGLFAYRAWKPAPGVELLLPTPHPPSDGVLKVYVTGAVAAPGVYELREGARVEEALAAAGGPTTEANLVALNLASRVRDEQHVHVPRIGESTEGSPTAGRININTASAAALESLYGIGPVRAQQIIEHRTKNGPFRRTEELVELRLVPASVYERIKDQITVAP
jgi:competence protein ComEA